MTDLPDDMLSPGYIKRLRADNNDTLDAWFAERGITTERAELKAEIAALLSEREANAKRIAELEAGLRYCGEAIDTGRSEPLFVARDLIRNTLLKETGDV